MRFHYPTLRLVQDELVQFALKQILLVKTSALVFTSITHVSVMFYSFISIRLVLLPIIPPMIDKQWRRCILKLINNS